MDYSTKMNRLVTINFCSFVEKTKNCKIQYWLMLSFTNWNKSDDNDDAVHKLCSQKWQSADC